MPKQRMTAEEFTNKAFDTAIANPSGAEAQVLLRLKGEYPDGVPATVIFQEMSKANKKIADSYELFDPTATPPAARAAAEPYVPGKGGNIRRIVGAVTGGAGSVGELGKNIVAGSTESFVPKSVSSFVDKAIDVAAPYTTIMNPATALPANMAMYAKTLAAPALRAIGATDIANTVETAAQTSQDLMAGFQQGLAELGFDALSPAGVAFIAAGGPMRAVATKFPKAARIASAVLSTGAISGSYNELRKELPEAYEALDKGDYQGFGKAIAKASGAAVLGLDSLKGVTGLKAKFREPGAHLPTEREIPRGVFPAAREVPAGAMPGAAPIPAGAFPGSRPIPPRQPDPGTAIDLRRSRQTGAPRTSPAPVESEAQQLLRLTPEELTAQRQMVAEQAAALERSAADQSQGPLTITMPLTGKLGKPVPSKVTIAKDAIPTETQAAIGQVRARLSLLDRVIGARERAGTIPPTNPIEAASGGPFPPETRAISVPDEIATKHGIAPRAPVEYQTIRKGEDVPAGSRVVYQALDGSRRIEAPSKSFDLNQIWRETPDQIQARVAGLARQRSSFTDASSPAAIEAERQIAALQDMLVAKRTAEIGGAAVPPVKPVGYGPSEPVTLSPTGVPPPPPTVPSVIPRPPVVAPSTVEPFIPGSVPPAPRLLQPTGGVLVPGQGSPAHYSGPLDQATMPEYRMYDQPSRPIPGQPANLLEAGSAAAKLTPGNIGRADMKALAEKHNVDIGSLRLVESASDQEVFGMIKYMQEMRKGVLTGKGGATSFPGAPPPARTASGRPASKTSKAFDIYRQKALNQIDSVIAAYTDILNSRAIMSGPGR